MIPLFNRQKPSSKSFYSIRNLLFILIFITFILILYSSLSLSPLLRFLDPYSYVLDAGSTGTRIHVYKFHASIDNENSDTFVLKNEIFKELKPGLSSFANDVSKAEDQINELLKIVDQEVSCFKHRSTPKL